MIKNTLIITILLFSLVACGSIEAPNISEGIRITTLCSTTGDTTDYHTLQSGDIIYKSDVFSSSTGEPIVKLFHTEDGLKKVCLVSGDAMIFR